MVQIDKLDELYKYLTNLGVNDVDSVYLELAQNGRYKQKDVKQYFQEMFKPSLTQDIDEKELEKVLDYYIDLKSIKPIASKQLKEMLLEYKQTKNENLRELIINSQLKDILHLCINYSTLHKKIDIQDLVQVANMGLLDAIQSYNPDAKIDFKDYVIYWVRFRVMEEFKGEENDK